MGKRWDTVCRKCRNAERRERRRASKLETGADIKDWATAMLPAIRYSCTHNKTPVSPHVTPAFLRDLMTEQHYMCQLLRRQFTLPQVEELGHRRNWSTWQKHLSQDRKELVPVLVRVRASGSWEPGNLIFIATKLLGLYSACGDALEFKDFCADLAQRPIVAYQPSRLAQHQNARLMDEQEIHEA